MKWQPRTRRLTRRAETAFRLGRGSPRRELGQRIQRAWLSYKECMADALASRADEGRG